MSKITIVAHPTTKEMFTATSNPEWVKCQLQSNEMVVNNGVIQNQKRVAFPLISAEVAESLAGLKSGTTFPLEGKIIRTLSSEPQFEGHQEVVNPTSGEVMGYYQSYEFTTDLSAHDVDTRQAVREEVKKEESVEKKENF